MKSFENHPCLVHSLAALIFLFVCLDFVESLHRIQRQTDHQRYRAFPGCLGAVRIHQQVLKIDSIISFHLFGLLT